MDTNVKLYDIIKEIKNVFLYLLKKWIILAIFGILGGVTGIILATLSKPKYTSHLSFALEAGENALSSAASLAASFGFNIGTGGEDIFSGDNILEIIKSRKIVENVLLDTDTLNGQKVRIIESWCKIHKFKLPKDKIVSFPLNQNKEEFSYLQDSVLYIIHLRIVQSLDAKRREKNLNIFDVNFTSNDERLTKIITERLVNKTIEYYTELKTKKSLDLLKNLEKRVQELEKSTKLAIINKGNILDANLNPAFATQSSELQVKQLDASIYGAAYTELYKNLEITRYQFLRNIPLLQIIDNVQYPMKRTRPRKIFYGGIGGVLTILLVSIFLYINYQKEFYNTIKQDV